MTDALGLSLPVLSNGAEAGVHATVRWWDGRYPSGTPSATSGGATAVLISLGAEPAGGTLDATLSEGVAWTNWCGDREDGALFFEVRHGDEVSVRRSIAPPLCTDPARQSRLAHR